MNKWKVVSVLACSAFLLAMSFSPIFVSAHEVYVLSPNEISKAIDMQSPNPFGAISGNELLFLGWGTLAAVVFLIVFRLSISRLFESVFDPFLVRLKKYAPFLGRLTFGVSIMTSGYFGSFFGPELSVSSVIHGAFAQAAGLVLMIVGACIVLGFLTRIMSFVGLCLFALTVTVYHGYMFTYVNYLGEMLLFLILGGGMWSFDRIVPFLAHIEKKTGSIRKRLEKYSFLILRILFGSAVVFASFYAKFLHSNLALETIRDYDLTHYFPFTPLFLVLGSFIVEALIGIGIAVGFEIRFLTLLFTFFLTLSILFFGEAVWPHIILFGVNITLFFHGYDKYTLEMALFQKKRRGEPVL